MNRQAKNWCPAIELNETNRDLILKAEVPGVEINQLQIRAETESIAISGIHNQHKSNTEKELIPSQLHYGQLECNVPLPCQIQTERVRAELVDGVLTVTLPKTKSHT